MPPAIAAVLTTVAGGTFVAGSALTLITSNVIAFGISMIAMAVMGRQSPAETAANFQAPTTDAYNAHKQIVRGAAVNRKIIYGEAKVGGLMTYVNTTDIKGWNREGNSDLFMAIAVAPHPIESYQDFFVNDKDSEWFTNSINWVNKDDIVTIIWHRNMDACTDGQGGNTMFWKGKVNGVEQGGGTPWGPGGENFHNAMTNLGFDVTSSFVDAGTHSNIKKHVETAKENTTNWSPQYNQTDPDPINWTATIPVYDYDFGIFVDKVVPAEQVTAEDGSNTWRWREEYIDIYGNDAVRYHVLQPEEVGYKDWKYSQWNEDTQTFDTLGQEYNPALEWQPTLNSKSGFTEFGSDPQPGSVGGNCELVGMEASIDEMPGILKIVPYKGSLTQQADPDFVDMFPEYTTAFKGRGVSYFTTQIFYDMEALPNGIPGYTTHVMGKNNLIDPRDIHDDWVLNVTQDVRNAVGKYSTNAAVIIMDYMISEFGLNIPLTEIDLDSFVIAANICDEDLQLVAAQSAMIGAQSVAPIEGFRTAVYSPDHGFSTNSDAHIVQGDVTVTSKVVKVVDKDNFIYASGGMTEGVAATVRLQQRRYTINGVIDTGTQPSGVINSMLSHTGGGSIVYDDGKYKLNVGFYKTPTTVITEDWIISDIKVQPRATRDQLFNAVKGTYIDAQGKWEPTDYEPWANEFYCQEDNKGVACGPTDYIYAPMDFPLCIEHTRARRLAKIHLNRARQALVVTMTCNLKAYKIDTGDNVAVIMPTMGWVPTPEQPQGKEFEVINWTFTTEQTIELTLQETASGIYDWNDGEYVDHDLASNTELPSLTWPNHFEDFTLTTAAYLDTGGAFAEQIIVNVLMDPAYDYVTYSDTEIEYRDVLKIPSDPWHVASKGKSLVASIAPVEMSLYAIRVRGTSKSAPPTPWYIKQIRTQGAGSLITDLSIPKPLDPAVYFSIQDNIITKLKFSTMIDPDDPEWAEQVALPEFVLFMYSAQETRNQLTMANDDLDVATTDVLETGELPILDNGNNLPNRIQLTEIDNPMPTGVDLTGQWWVRVRQQDGTTFTIFTKALWYDHHFVYLNRELYLDGDTSETPYVPTATDTLEWYRVAFHDTRLGEFKIGSILDEDTGEYEIIRWEDLQYNDAHFSLTGVTREAEQSVKLDATGKVFNYYPAPGPGTSVIAIPASSFDYTGFDTYQSTYEVDIAIPNGLNWAAMTCCFARNTMKDGVPVVARSAIVLPSYRGEI